MPISQSRMVQLIKSADGYKNALRGLKDAVDSAVEMATEDGDWQSALLRVQARHGEFLPGEAEILALGMERKHFEAKGKWNEKEAARIRQKRLIAKDRDLATPRAERLQTYTDNQTGEENLAIAQAEIREAIKDPTHMFREQHSVEELIAMCKEEFGPVPEAVK